MKLELNRRIEVETSTDNALCVQITQPTVNDVPQPYEVLIAIEPTEGEDLYTSLTVQQAHILATRICECINSIEEAAKENNIKN